MIHKLCFEFLPSKCNHWMLLVGFMACQPLLGYLMLKLIVLQAITIYLCSFKNLSNTNDFPTDLFDSFMEP